MKLHISPARVREVFTLDKKRGVLIWKIRLSNRAPCIGSDAGHLDNWGYIRIGVDGRLYLAHRLIWMFITEEMPPEFLDHKNGRRTDNRFVNLRVVTKGGNQQNMRTARRDSTTGVLGVMPGRMVNGAQRFVLAEEVNILGSSIEKRMRTPHMSLPKGSFIQHAPYEYHQIQDHGAGQHG